MRGPVGARCFLFLPWSVVLVKLIKMSDGVGITFLVAFKSAAILSSSVCYVSTHMIVHRLEDFLWRNQQRCHLPNGHLKVHLRKLE